MRGCRPLHRQGGPQHRGHPDPGPCRIAARSQASFRGPSQSVPCAFISSRTSRAWRRFALMIRVGQVGGAYGLEGAVKVIPLTDFDDRFNAGSKLMLDGAEREVEWSRPGHPGLVLKLSGIDDRTRA